MFVLIVQKDTLEHNKVKSVINVCDNPNEYLTSLQESHPIEYQLIASTSKNEDLNSRLSNFIGPFKTNHGKDWYEFDHDALTHIISLFLEYDTCHINLNCISSIIGFSLTMFPVVTKEVVVNPLNKSEVKPQSKSEIHSKPDIQKEEIMSLIENLEKSDIPKRKKDRKSKH